MEPSQVVIQNTPKVPRAKEDKLKGVLAKLVTKIGKAKTIEMPFKDDMSMGYARHRASSIHPLDRPPLLS